MYEINERKRSESIVEDNMDLMRKAAGGAMQTIKMKDGKLLPIEMTVKVRFDPNTQKLEVIS